MMKIRGNNLWPLTVDAVVFGHGAVEEYAGRVYVDEAGRTEVEVRLGLKASAPRDGSACAALCREVAARIKAATNVQMRVHVVAREALPTFTYKARRWTDERREGMRKQ
jgi:phenylacetate-CoA ligase